LPVAAPFWYKFRLMDPVCFYIGSRPIYWYGVMVAIAFLAAVAHWNALSKRDGYPTGFGSELGFWMMLAGIIGARIAYIVANFHEFAPHPIEIIRIDHGGLIFYGGLIGAAVGLVIMALIRKDPVLRLADLAISGLPLGHAIGRVGCFMNGCCYGSCTTLPWGVHLQGAFRHPTQLYEAFFNLVVYVFLLNVYLRRKNNGIVLAAYLLTYPVGRFLLEFIRGDSRLQWLGMNVAQEISLAMFAAGIILWLWLRKSAAEKQEVEPENSR